MQITGHKHQDRLTKLARSHKNHELKILMWQHQQANPWSRVMKLGWRKRSKNVLPE